GVGAAGAGRHAAGRGQPARRRARLPRGRRGDARTRRAPAQHRLDVLARAGARARGLRGHEGGRAQLHHQPAGRAGPRPDPGAGPRALPGRRRHRARARRAGKPRHRDPVLPEDPAHTHRRRRRRHRVARRAPGRPLAARPPRGRDAGRGCAAPAGPAGARPAARPGRPQAGRGPVSPRTPRRHDHDAGGDPELLAAKAALREEAWAALSAAKVARFPGARNRITNFTGAEAAARRLAETPFWQAATTIKANPDSAQLPVRRRALEDGKTVYMAVPRLAEPEPFFLLDPDHLADPPRRAASIAGATRSARRVAVADLTPVDIVVSGCVAVGEDGARLGKGG